MTINIAILLFFKCVPVFDLCNANFNIFKMKKLVNRSLLVALMLGSLSSYASETYFEKGTNNGVITTSKNVKKRTHLFIKTVTGKVVHEQTINVTNTGINDLDTSSLKDGYYTLEINKDFEIDVLNFTVVKGEAIFHKETEKTIFKPVLRNEKNKILVSKLDFEGDPMKIAIYHENEVIYRDIVEGENLMKKVYVLQENIKGTYKVVAIANNRIYKNEFTID